MKDQAKTFCKNFVLKIIVCFWYLWLIWAWSLTIQVKFRMLPNKSITSSCSIDIFLICMLRTNWNSIVFRICNLYCVIFYIIYFCHVSRPEVYKYSRYAVYMLKSKYLCHAHDVIDLFDKVCIFSIDRESYKESAHRI